MLNFSTLSKFLEFDVINNTMFCLLSNKEFDFLKENNWKLWKKALIDLKVGNGKKYGPFPQATLNTIHQAYHLAFFMKKTNLQFKDFDNIVEVGGGYGCLSRLIHNIGFEGNYNIIDLPEFSYLQEYYLSFDKNLKKKITRNFDNKINLINNVENISKINLKSGKNNLFIGLWSLSETNLKFREKIINFLERQSNFKYMIGFQKQFEEINNVEYFNSLKEKESNLTWILQDIGFLEDNYYIFGF